MLSVWWHSHEIQTRGSFTVSQLLPAQLDAVQYGTHIYAGDACRTARLVFPRKCWEVQALMRELPVLPSSAPCSPSLGPAKRAGSKRKPAAPQRRKNASQVVLAVLTREPSKKCWYPSDAVMVSLCP